MLSRKRQNRASPWTRSRIPPHGRLGTGIALVREHHRDAGAHVVAFDERRVAHANAADIGDRVRGWSRLARADDNPRVTCPRSLHISDHKA